MAEIGKHKFRYGLIGRHISYSFSQGYFSAKFKELGLIEHSYENFDLEDIAEFKDIIAQTNLKGLNVTIPYKEQVMPFLDEIDKDAKTIGAINTIKFLENGLKGYNTDAFGFESSLKPLLKDHHKKALVLGTGGASKAITFVFDKIGIDYAHVSRKPVKDQFHYSALDKLHFQEFQLVINCSPVGTYPDVGQKPQIPYQHLNSGHILFDLIYNPSETAFLSEGKKRGATIQNGLPMLQFQAEKAWEIWNSPS